MIRDRSISAASSGTVSADFQSDPNKTFNRGYTDYFFKGKQRQVSSIDTPKMRGEYIGKIITVRDNYFILDKSPSLSNGDGIAFFVNDQLHGTNINETRGNKVYPASSQHLKTGTAVYRNYDHQYLSRLKTAPLARNINMVYKIEQTATGLQIIAKDEDDNSVETVISDFEIARNREAAQKNLVDSLSKTGQTIFACSKIECNLKEFPHFRKSHINKIRRQLLDRLLAERIANKPDRGVRIKPNTFPYPASRLDYRGNVINQKARDFYLRHGVESIEHGIEKRQNIGYPIVMTTKYCIKKELGFCTKDTSGTATGNWKLVDNEGNTFTLIFHCNKCEMDVIREG